MDQNQNLTGQNAIKEGVRLILTGLGLDLDDDNIKETPDRVSKMYGEMFLGGFGDVEQILSKTFPSSYSGILVHKNLLVFSACPHHLLPVEYEISLAYIAEKVVGLSKVPRAVEVLAKRLVLQETLTEDIATALEKYIGATAVLVIVKGQHACMRIRGVRTLTDQVVTSSIKGIFEKEPAARAEALALLGVNV